jgi:type II secretory pathway pseudopilin PulG
VRNFRSSNGREVAREKEDESMSYCAFCGTEVAPGTAVCAQCGNPPSGVRQPAVTVKGPRSGFPLVAILIAAGFGVLFVVGIIAAIFIPNFLDALAKAKLKRSVADIRNVGTALVSYGVDHDGVYPPGQSLQELSSALVPDYLSSLPSVDGWKHPYRYSCWRESSSAPGCDHFRLASAGRDGVFESEDLSRYDQETFATTDYDRDIVFGDGYFLQYPVVPGQRQP